ncbi:hypothetical protein TNCV_4624061 [Trichonephila clavipes]|nr:hypothetical protein TNCV_4624061 [Trichonephila clavipes]
MAKSSGDRRSVLHTWAVANCSNTSTLTLPRLTRIRSYAIFDHRRFFFRLRKKNGEVGNVLEEFADLAIKFRSG